MNIRSRMENQFFHCYFPFKTYFPSNVSTAGRIFSQRPTRQTRNNVSRVGKQKNVQLRAKVNLVKIFKKLRDIVKIVNMNENPHT